MRVPRTAPRKTMEWRWVSERERITPNRTPFVVFAPDACAPRRGAARRAARAPFMAAATRGVVGPRSCALVWVQATTVPRPISRALVAPIRGDTATASATATVELGFRRERTATNRQDEAQNATGESVPRAPFLSHSLCPSRSYARSLAGVTFWLSLRRSRESRFAWSLISRSVPRKSVLRDSVLETTSDRGCKTERECDCPSSRFPR